MSEAGFWRRAGQDPWDASGEAGFGLALQTSLRGLLGPRAQSGWWLLLALPCCLLCDPALNPALSALGLRRRKLLVAEEEALAGWFPRPVRKTRLKTLFCVQPIAGVGALVWGVARAWDRS